MQTNNRILDDAARLAGGAIGTLAGVRRELEAMARQQFERLLAGMDLVSRDEFEAVKTLAANARAEQERLAERVAALEAALAAKKPRKPSAAKRPAAGRTPDDAAPSAGE